MAFDIQTCARPNILALEPYRCARDDYKDDGTNVLLDANENSYGHGLSLDGGLKLSNGNKQDGNSASASHLELDPNLDLTGLHRYPDPHQEELKQLICDLRHDPKHYSPNAPRISPANLFVGVGSDEAIDSLIRCFCTPGMDRILICPPTYGMYTVSACVNDVDVVKVPLDVAHDEFALDTSAVAKTLSDDAAAFAKDPSQGRIKLVFICSPGNPTGKLVAKADVEAILSHPQFNGLVVLDEAYIDFSAPSSSLASAVTSYPNLVVMQTLSKGFGLAGIRLGAAFCSPQVARLMNSMKAPYNISSLTSQVACRAFAPESLAVMRQHQARILQQRDRMIKALPAIPGVGKLKGGLDSNFLLVELLDRPGGRPDNGAAIKAYETLAAALGVVCRFRGKEYGCEGCLRVTVGTEAEVTRFLAALQKTLQDIYAQSVADTRLGAEKTERMESSVVT